MSLNYHEQQTVLSRFPKFELSYEKISHKKVSDSYTLAIAIPRGKKYFVWFSFHLERNVCFMLETNKDKKIINVRIVENKFNKELSLGTVLYGSVISDEVNPNKWVFAAEDIYYYRGKSVISCTFNQKLEFIRKIMVNNINSQNHSKHAKEDTISMVCVLPIMWITHGGGVAADTIPSPQMSRIGYPVHHIKYVEPYRISPYCNVIVNKFGGSCETGDEIVKKDVFKKEHLPIPFMSSPIKFNYSAPIYKLGAIFKVIADIQFDIYHLYARGKTIDEFIYVGVAGVPTYKTSVYLNSLFRKIRENENIDYIEESDDEEDFQKVDLSKYVDPEKEIEMECEFNFKHKKWIPYNVCPKGTRIVEFSALRQIEAENVDYSSHKKERNDKYKSIHSNKKYGNINKANLRHKMK